MEPLPVKDPTAQELDLLPEHARRFCEPWCGLRTTWKGATYARRGGIAHLVTPLLFCSQHPAQGPP